MGGCRYGNPAPFGYALRLPLNYNVAMSIARLADDSDVYVFETETSGGQRAFCCSGCSISSPEYFCQRPGQMIQHLRTHVIFGDKVPDYAFESLAAMQPAA